MSEVPRSVSLYANLYFLAVFHLENLLLSHYTEHQKFSVYTYIKYLLTSSSAEDIIIIKLQATQKIIG